MPSVWAAIILSLLLGMIVARLLACRPWSATWPAFILLAYVVYPEVNTPLALQIAAVSLVAGWIQWQASRARPQVEGRITMPWPAVLAGIAAFVLYVTTLAPDVLAADSGELQGVAAQLGVAHPPGFPLYVMVAHLFVRLLPFVSPAYAVNLFSAVTSAMTIGVVYYCVNILSDRHIPAVVTAIALATATTYWSQATTANVRSLTGLFAALIILALIRFRNAIAHSDIPSADRWLILAALAMGFGMTHHVSLLFLILVGLAFVVLADRSLLRAPRRWLWPVVAALLGLLPLLYLPLRASADVRGASSDLATWPGFLEHVLAIGFRGDLFYYLAPAELGQRLLIMGNVLTFQFAPLILFGILIGLILVIRQDRALAFLLAGIFVVYVLVAATYRAPQTVEYMIPGYIAAAILLGWAVGWLPVSLSRFGWWGKTFSILFSALMLVAAIGQLPRNISASGAKHEAMAARNYALPLLASAPPNSVILAHWHWVTPLWYLREIEGIRSDVDVRFVFPEGESYEETWQRRTREAFAEGRPVITTWLPSTELEDLPTAEPLGEAALFPREERTLLPPDFISADLSLGGAIAVVGYRVDLSHEALSPGDEAAVTVAWRPKPAFSNTTGLFVHLVGADNVIYAQDDQPALPADGLTLTRFRLTPRPGTPVETLTLFIGATGESAERMPLATLSLSQMHVASFTQNKTQRRLMDGSGDVLIGYDWDHTLAGRRRLYLHWQTGDGFRTQLVDDVAIDKLGLPPFRGLWGVPARNWRFPGDRDDRHYVPLGESIVWTGKTLNGASLLPGESIVLDQRLHSSQAINRDYVVSVRLIGLEPDELHWAWWDLQDSIPAMGAIPTLKWVRGSSVRSPHRVTVAGTAESGQALTGALILYDAFTNQALPILDERITAETPWIPLGRAAVR